INAPKCPFHLFQQDGHMAMRNPRGRVNYEPNAWEHDGGPREDREREFRSYPAHKQGAKVQARSETFADHYSQARQFYISQTEVERRHIIAAYTFELSKVETLAIRRRIVGHLRNVDETELARGVAEGLGFVDMPEPATPAKSPRVELPPSPALSIINNGPGSFRGRKLGVVVGEGSDATLLAALRQAIMDEGAWLEIVASTIAGVVGS